MFIIFEGILFALMFFVVSFVCYFLSKYSNWFLVIAIIAFLKGCFCLYFFRNPSREISQEKTEICSPADGKIIAILEEDHPKLGRVKVIRIFLSIFNVHVQRAPIAGKIVDVHYNKGKFLPAMHEKAHLDNEQNDVLFEDELGRKILCKQIAGIIARRIVLWKKQGDMLKKGELYGMIRFGSQVDIYLPLDTEILVKPKDRVSAGTTVLARFK